MHPWVTYNVPEDTFYNSIVALDEQIKVHKEKDQWQITPFLRPTPIHNEDIHPKVSLTAESVTPPDNQQRKRSHLRTLLHVLCLENIEPSLETTLFLAVDPPTRLVRDNHMVKDKKC